MELETLHSAGGGGLGKDFTCCPERGGSGDSTG